MPLQQFNQVTIIMRNKFVITTADPETFHFDLPKDAGINLKHEIYPPIKHNEILAEHTIKTKVR